MGGICGRMEDMIGGTPLAELRGTEAAHDLKCRLLAKVEYMNPCGSVKDRVARAMIDDAEKRGALTPGSTIIEPTSGSTGIALAAIGACRGYRVIIVMPENMSGERKKLMRAYGAELVETGAAHGMKGAIAKADELKREIPGAFIPGQFSNPANPAAHYNTTAPEIWRAAGGDIDAFVCGVGTGGTITGIGRFLKERRKDIRVIAVEPALSPFLSEGRAGVHGIQGIGAGFKPGVLDESVYDEIITVTDDDANRMCREIAKCEGMLVGISSGAAAWAAVKLAGCGEFRGKTIVTLFPDSGERYLSAERQLK